MREVKESDWKKFRGSLERWRERYLEKVNAQLLAIANQPNKTATERFWETQELTHKQGKIVCDCLDDLRRSKMVERLWAMRGCGMITREDLADFSPELQAAVFFGE